MHRKRCTVFCIFLFTQVDIPYDNNDVCLCMYFIFHRKVTTKGGTIFSQNEADLGPGYNLVEVLHFYEKNESDNVIFLW